MESNLNNLRETIQKIGDMAYRSVVVFNEVHKWIENNSDIVCNYVRAFADLAIWNEALSLMEAKQIIFTDHLSLAMASEFCAQQDIEAAVWGYYSKNDSHQLNALIERCRNSIDAKSWSYVLFEQSINAFHLCNYQLSCTGLFALMDGILAQTSEIIRNPNFEKRFNAIEDKINDRITLSDMDMKLFCVCSGISILIDKTFGYSDFSKPEPIDIINRHWVLHGRTTRGYKGIDVLKLLLTLDAIIFLSDLCDKPLLDDKGKTEAQGVSTE